MKRLLLLSLITFLCLPLTVYAASIGGAETQGQGKFSIGLDQEFVFDRDMKFVSSRPPLLAGWEMKDFEIDNLYRTMLKTSYGLLDNIDVYMKLGLADFDAEGKIYAGGIYLAKREYKGKDAFAYGLGLKGAYNLEKNWIIGADVQYLRHRNKVTIKSIDPVTGATIAMARGKAPLREWQVAPYFGYKIENFIPYLGVKYSDVRIKAKYPTAWVKYKADDNFGVFLGADYKIGENWKLNLETRFIDETALSFTCTYIF